MDILKSLKLILRFRPAGAKRTKLESWAMAQERFIGHLNASIKGHRHHFKYLSGGRLAQSKMDRTKHALFLAKLRLASIP